MSIRFRLFKHINALRCDENWWFLIDKSFLHVSSYLLMKIRHTLLGKIINIFINKIFALTSSLLFDSCAMRFLINMNWLWLDWLVWMRLFVLFSSLIAWYSWSRRAWTVRNWRIYRREFKINIFIKLIFNLIWFSSSREMSFLIFVFHKLNCLLSIKLRPIRI